MPYDLLGAGVEDQAPAAGASEIDIAFPSLDQPHIVDRGVGEALATQYVLGQIARLLGVQGRPCSLPMEAVKEVRCIHG